MKLSLWMLTGSALSSFGIVTLLGEEAASDLRLSVWLGMLAPLAAAMISVVLVERIFRRRPDRLMGVMIGAFAGKIVFFGAYIALVVKSGWVRTVPFAISFMGYFLALHLIEAWRLRRLVAAA
jgi:drug/metabolite transporter (DMT)-like permease